MELSGRVQRRCFMFDGQKVFIVHVVDVKNPATLQQEKCTNALNANIMFP